MAQNVTVAGASYPDVPSVILPKTGGGSATFIDPSVTTATASDVASGKVFIAADGTQTTGTGASIVTSTYNSGNVTLNTSQVSAAWWGGLDPERLYQADYTCALSDTDYASKTPSTSAQSLKQPAAGYTSSASTTIVYDRWGSGYHSGSALNFAAYDYFVLNETMVNIAYTSDESTLGLVHSIQHACVYLQPIGQSFRFSSNSVVTPTSSTTGTTRCYSLGFYETIYRNASNNLAIGSTVSYGIFPSVQAPTFASTSALTSNYINFRSPTLSIRTNNTYMVAGAWTYVDAANTVMTNRQILYRVRKQDMLEQAFTRLQSMWEGKTIPTEVI